jgi:hypothetical protein
LTCLICGAICCQTHGDYISQLTRTYDDVQMADKDMLGE